MRLRLFGRTSRDALTCQKAVALVGDYLDGALTDELRRRLERHLADCPHCTEYVAQLRVTITASAQPESMVMSAARRQDFIDLYRRTMGT